MAAVRVTGTVKWFSDQKGYGFIEDPAGGRDIFVHHSQIRMDGYRILNEGEPVEYEPVEGPKGTEARSVVRLDPSFTG